MKIFLINQEHAEFSGPGGAERSVQSIAEYFASQGHDVSFLAIARRDYQRNMADSGIHSIRMINGVRTIMVGRRGTLPSHADVIRTVILSDPPDIIHTNVFHTAPQLWAALAPLGIPILHTLREYKLMCDRNMFTGVRDCGEPCQECGLSMRYARDMSGLVDGVVGISRFTLTRHLDHGLFGNAALAAVIPNSYRAVRPVAPKPRRPAGMPVRVGFLGRMHASKGINLIMDVVSELPADALRLSMAGDLQDPDIMKRMEALKQTHDISYLGFTDPTVFFADIDVLLAPSIWHEPFGRITIEAFAHGVPVITTDRGGLPDIVTHGETGWVFNPDHPQELKDILLRLGDTSEATLAQMVARCIETAKRYEPHVVGEAYLEAYRKVIAAKARTAKPVHGKLRALHARDISLRGGLVALRTNRPARERRPLKIVIFTGEFPKLSETFVLNHVTGLIDLGHDVRVLHTREGRPDQVPRDFLTYQVQERCVSTMPPDHWRRVMQTVTQPLRATHSRLGAIRGQSDKSTISTVVAESQGLLTQAEQNLIDLYAVQQIREKIGQPDIIHCHFGHRPRTMFKYMDMGAFDAPVVCSFHGIDMSAHIRSKGPELYDDIRRRLAKAMPVSDYFRRRLIGLGFNPKDVQVHRVGIDTRKFGFSERRRGEGEPLLLVSVGRLVPKKGFAYGIRAVARALEMRPGLPVRYIIAGEGDGHAELSELIATLGLHAHVDLIGAQPHQYVTDLLARSHAMLAPSVTGEDGDQEGIPTVTMEAMATGLPVLSTFHSGIPEAVVDGYTGFLAPERNVDVLAEYILHLYDNPDLGPQLGRQGRAHVSLEFNIQRQNQKVVELYERIIRGEED